MTKQQAEMYKDMFQELKLTELLVEEEGIKLQMKREQTPCAEKEDSYSEVWTPRSEKAEVTNEEALEKDSRIAVKAPLLGIFHSAPAPGNPPFVEEGDVVKRGDVLCIIEAMKMMNEITAQADGIVASIMAKENDIVEYGETLLFLNGGKHDA